MAYDPYKESLERRPSQTVPIVAPSDVRGAQATAEALQGIARGVGDLGDAVRVRDELLADAEARKALSARQVARNDYFFAPETGLLNQRGGNGVGIREGARTRLAALDDEYAQGLSPRAERAYRQAVEGQRPEEYATVDRHSAQQTERFIIEGRTASINAEVENAVLNFSNPEAFESHLNSALVEQRDLASLNGTAPEELVNQQRELVSGAVKARILRTATSDPMAAKALLDSERGRLSPEAQHSLDTALEGPVTEAQANSFVSHFIGTPDQVRPNADARVLARGPIEGISFQYAMGPNRPNRPDDSVLTVVGGAVKDVLGPGARVVVTSGQEDSGRQYGSARHKTGLAADIAVYDAAGTKLSANDPRMAQVAEAAAARGAQGIGFGGEYMGGDHMHVDLVDPGSVGGGNVWGSGAKANAGRIIANMRSGGANAVAEARAPAQEALRNANLPVTPVNEYLVNTRGEETATAILRAAPGALMKDIDPAFTGDPLTTVARFRDMATREIGADEGSVAGRYIDTVAAMDAAMSIEDPKVRAAALAKIAQFDNLNNVAKDRAADAAFDQAWTDYKVSGNTQVPLELQLAMGPGKLSTLQQTMMAGDQTVTNMATYEALMEATADPRRMAAVNLRDHVADLSEADYRFFVAQQANANSALNAADAKNEEKLAQARIVNHSQGWSDVEDIFIAAGLPARADTNKLDGDKRAEAEQARLRAQRQYAAALEEFVVKEGRAPNYLEQRSIASEMTMPVVMAKPGGGFWRGVGKALGFGGGDDAALWEQPFTEPGTEVTGTRYTIQDVPPADRASIASYLQAQGTRPTFEAVAEEYGRRELVRAGAAPAMIVDDIPPAERAKLENIDPPFSEAEMVTIYNTYRFGN